MYFSQRAVVLFHDDDDFVRKSIVFEDPIKQKPHGGAGRDGRNALLALLDILLL